MWRGPPSLFLQVDLNRLFTVDQHTCSVLGGGALLRPDCRCDQSCLSAPPLALVGVTMLHLVRETLRGEESAVEVMWFCYYHVGHFHCIIFSSFLSQAKLHEICNDNVTVG